MHFDTDGASYKTAQNLISDVISGARGFYQCVKLEFSEEQWKEISRSLYQLDVTAVDTANAFDVHRLDRE